MTSQPMTILQAVDRGIFKLRPVTGPGSEDPLNHIVVSRTPEGAPSQQVVKHSPYNWRETGFDGPLINPLSIYRDLGAVWAPYMGPDADSAEFKAAAAAVRRGA